MFNNLFVIAICGLFSETVLRLNWWPIVRDSAYYLVSSIVLLIILCTDYVSWITALLMIVLYGAYYVLLSFNSPLEQWAYSLKLPIKLPGKVDQPTVDEEKQKDVGTTVESGEEIQKIETPSEVVNDYYYPKTPRPILNPLEKQENLTKFPLYLWYIVYPVHYLCRLTIPNVRTENYRSWYPISFIVSLLWIGFYSYFNVWMVLLIGETMRINSTILGLTLVAAALAIPDVVNSLIILKDGYGNMVLANLLGSNIFNFLLSLGLSWFLKTAVIAPGTQIAVDSISLGLLVFLFFTSLIILLVVIHLNEWKVDKRFGHMMVILKFYPLIITLHKNLSLQMTAYMVFILLVSLGVLI